MIKYPDNQWGTVIKETLSEQTSLLHFLEQSYGKTNIFPSKENIFKAYETCDVDNVKVVIIGQDPYIKEGQANGLSFSVENKCKTPPSLRNIFKELEIEYGILRTRNDLSDWSKQGVLLINQILTVESKKSLSHENVGWEDFTEKIIQYLDLQNRPIIFVCFGKNAFNCYKRSVRKNLICVEVPHPSPLSAYRGFLNSGVFQKIDTLTLENFGEKIKWV